MKRLIRAAGLVAAALALPLALLLCFSPQARAGVITHGTFVGELLKALRVGNMPTVAPTNGQALVYNSTTDKLEYGAAGTSLTGTGTDNSLPRYNGTDTIEDTQLLVTDAGVLESAAGTDLVLRPYGTGSAASRSLLLKATPNGDVLQTFLGIDPDNYLVYVEGTGSNFQVRGGTGVFAAGTAAPWDYVSVSGTSGILLRKKSSGAGSVDIQAAQISTTLVNDSNTGTAQTAYLDLQVKTGAGASVTPFLRLNGETNVADVGTRTLVGGSALGTPTWSLGGSAGIAALGDGAVGAPALTNTGDLDTGVFFPADNQVALTTGGTQRLLASSAGVSVNANVLSTTTSLNMKASSGDGLTIFSTDVVGLEATNLGIAHDGIYTAQLGGGSNLALADGVAGRIVAANCPSGSSVGGSGTAVIYASDGVDFQTRTIQFTWSAVNKAGVLTIQLTQDATETVAASTGTLTATVTAVAATDEVEFRINATSSLTQTLFYGFVHGAASNSAGAVVWEQ